MQNAHENAFPTGATAGENGDHARQASYYLWRDLARKRALTLPAKSLPLSPRLMRKWLRRLHTTPTEHAALCGFRTLDAFIERNPGVPLYAWVGQLLETLEYHPWLLEAR